MVTFLSYISNACHSLSGVAERLQHTLCSSCTSTVSGEAFVVAFLKCVSKCAAMQSDEVFATAEYVLVGAASVNHVESKRIDGRVCLKARASSSSYTDSQGISLATILSKMVGSPLSASPAALEGKDKCWWFWRRRQRDGSAFRLPKQKCFSVYVRTCPVIYIWGRLEARSTKETRRMAIAI